jgi:hypothetical protein
MQYVSLDIETTGLDLKKNQIVEVGAVLDCIGSTTPIKDLPKFRAVLLHDEMSMGTYCANLHKDLWAEILEITPEAYLSVKNYGAAESSGTLYCFPEKFESFFHNWLYQSLQLPSNVSEIKINIAGKNAGTFDIPFLEALPGWQGLVKFRRRVLDPASHCILPSDEHIPDLQECLKRCGLGGTVNHTAVDDAIDIVRIIRHQRVGYTRSDNCRRCRSDKCPICRYRDNCEVLLAECNGFEPE